MIDCSLGPWAGSEWGDLDADLEVQGIKRNSTQNWRTSYPAIGDITEWPFLIG